MPRFGIGIISFAMLFAGGCTVGQRMTRLKPGMSHAAVVRILGKPDGFRTEHDSTILRWTNKLISGWSWDTADYFVILKDDHAVEYGAGEVRVKEVGGVHTVFLHRF